jgi:DNA gyrase subunit A
MSETETGSTGSIRPVKIEDEVRTSYLDYAMSVIVSRALPDIRDGLKPVHRRILYAMNDMGIRHNSAYKKCARIVGEVLGKYHPHGDAPVYEALVRMAQDFSMRYTLVDGQGNFGSVDNDPPAAMRYTEARLAQIAAEMLLDIEKETVDFVPNFDDSLKEPSVLPSRLPNLLVNGSSGIAVGMATNIPPHNLTEICQAAELLIDNPDASIDQLIALVPGPDFPTGGIIMGREEIRRAYTTGQGKVVVRGATDTEEMAKGRHRIVITELPYQTNKAEFVEKIAIMVKDKKIEGISDLRDESDRQGMRVVIELKKDAEPKRVLNSLYKHTALQSTFFVNMLALVDREPRVIGLKEAVQHYIDFRKEIVTRRSQFDLKQAKDRAHILEGLKTALDQLDLVVDIIRHAKSTDVARAELMAQLSLSQIQAQAILDLQLRRLVALEQQKIMDEYTQVIKTIGYLEDLLANPRKILLVIKQETEELKLKHGDSRKTRISDEEATTPKDEDMITPQEVVVTLSSRGYIKRVPVDTYRLQHRGGKGVRGMTMKEAESPAVFLSTNTHDTLLFFTNRGRVFSLKCYKIPQDMSRTAKGTPLVNLLPITTEEQVLIAVKADFTPGNFLVLATAKGRIKRTPVEKFAAVRSRGLIAMALPAGDELVAGRLASDNDDIIMVSEQGKSIRFAVIDARAMSRATQGVRGIRLSPGDKVVSMDIVDPDAYVLTVTSHGYGKMSPMGSFPVQHRGGKGVLAHRVNPKVGVVVAARLTTPDGELMLISERGTIIRVPKESISHLGRSTQGVSLMKVNAGTSVVSIDCLETDSKDSEPSK